MSKREIHGYFPEVASTALAIRDLRIQGAINVAKRAITSLRFYILRESPGKDELARHIHLLLSQRPTEPALQNSLKKILSDGNPADACSRILGKIEQGSKEIISNGVPLVENSSVIMTHCHASTVTSILIRARREGKRFFVMHTETRPRYQGHRTARELLGNGIRPTMFVDSAINYFMPEVDFCLVGSDAITSDGFFNKIGTSHLALSAREHKKPLYVVSGLLKFSFSPDLRIEKRPKEELGFHLPGLSIENPAFDFTPSKFVSGIVCERGILPFKRAEKEARKYLSEL